MMRGRSSVRPRAARQRPAGVRSDRRSVRQDRCVAVRRRSGADPTHRGRHPTTTSPPCSASTCSAPCSPRGRRAVAAGGRRWRHRVRVVGDRRRLSAPHGALRGVEGRPRGVRPADDPRAQAREIRVSRLTSGSVAGTGFGDNFEPDEVAAAYPEWVASGYLTRVAGPGMDASWMADAFVFLLTRPQGQMIDVIHVRSFGSGAATVTHAD